MMRCAGALRTKKRTGIEFALQIYVLHKAIEINVQFIGEFELVVHPAQNQVVFV